MSTTAKDLHKVIRLGTVKHGWDKTAYSVFCAIKFTDGRLSITGVEGPLASGNARGGCGQIEIVPDSITSFAPGWDREKLAQFKAVWDKWHLNDLKAGTPAQEAYLETQTFPGHPTNHYDWACKVLAEAGLNPDSGYSYGSKWLRVEVPDEIIDFLQSLPDTDKTPAWV